MQKRLAILQVADTGPLESLVVMLRSVGWTCALPSSSLKNLLRKIGCDTVLEIKDLVSRMGYDEPMSLPEAGIADMARSDAVYVDVKAHRNYERVVKHWPSLHNRVLWYRINGGQPEHVINARGDHGDEVNPPCPILTPNLWYAMDCIIEARGNVVIANSAPWKGRAYACWPPFHRIDQYQANGEARKEAPICLIHNINGWGYRDLIPNIRALGVRCYGAGSPDGLMPHSRIPELLRHAKAMVHLKSSDAPGYALYESLAAGCPIICSRRLIWRNRMQDLLTHGETCLTFDRETHEGLTPKDVEECTLEIESHLRKLSDPVVANVVGIGGRVRLKGLMWSEKRDVDSLRAFLSQHFG